MKQSRIELFERWAETYDDAMRGSGEFPLLGRERVLDRVVSLTEAGLSMQVLDIGTGIGDLAAQFVQLGCAVWGLDFSGNMLAHARLKVPDATFVQADLQRDRSPELQRRFDRIVSAYVFHEFHLTEKVDLLRRFFRYHIVDGGRAAIGDVASVSTEAREAVQRRWTDLWDDHEHNWPPTKRWPPVPGIGFGSHMSRFRLVMASSL